MADNRNSSTAIAPSLVGNPPKKPSSSAWEWSGRVLAVGLLALLVGYPLFELFATALSERLVALNVRGSLEAAGNTLWTGAAVTVLAVIGGTAAALITERAPVPGRRWLRIGMVLPILIPPFVSALSWAKAYGPSGLTEDVVGIALPGLFGPFGVVLVITVHVMPLSYLVVAAGLASRSEPDLERAARASGSTPTKAFLTVTLPLLRPALVGAAVLVFVTAVNSFGIPAILGIPAGFVTVTTRIYQDLAFAADPAAFARAIALSSGLVLLTLAVVGVTDVAVGLRGAATRTGAPAGASPSVRGRARGLAAALWTYLALSTLLPLIALVLIALTRAVGLPPVPSNWTLANFGEALSGRGTAALGRSFVLAFVAATTVVLLGGLLAALERRRFGRRLGTVAVLTFAVPGSALAAAVLLAYGPWLRDSLLIILVAYLAKFWAVGHRPISGSVEALPPDLYRAARTSGAPAWVALRTVVLPLLRPAVAGAWLLVFLFAVHELTMSSLLYGPGTETMAVIILNLQQLGDVSVTSALAVLLTAVVLLAATPLLLIRGAGTGLGGESG